MLVRGFLFVLLVVASQGCKFDKIIENWRFPFHKTPEEFQAKVNRYASLDSSQCFVVAGSDAGLANRLRALFAYKVVARTVYNCAQLVFEWEVNDACPGHFLSVFEPLPNITFISSAQRSILAPHAREVFNNSRETFMEALLRFDVDSYVKKRGFSVLELYLYEQLVPVREIRETITEWVIAHPLCNAAAVHIRKTDLEQTLFHKRRTAIEAFYRWVEALPENETVFLSTDNPTTQRDFIDRYGWGKILVYRNISDADESSSPSQRRISSDPVSNSSQYDAKTISWQRNYQFLHSNNEHKPALLESSKTNNQEQKISERRFTGLQHAVIDVFLTAHCKHFRISAFSSFSELVKTMSYLHRWHWCGCEFRGNC